jgi:hypothetical protein
LKLHRKPSIQHSLCQCPSAIYSHFFESNNFAP